MLASIDESSINRKTKREYSWIPKGKTSTIWNMNSSGWLSMIAVIFLMATTDCLCTIRQHRVIYSEIIWSFYTTYYQDLQKLKIKL